MIETVARQARGQGEALQQSSHQSIHQAVIVQDCFAETGKIVGPLIAAMERLAGAHVRIIAAKFRSDVP